MSYDRTENAVIREVKRLGQNRRQTTHVWLV
jgi:hypothetical protein